MKIVFKRSRESGVALLLVLFVVALSTIITVNLAYSSFIEGRLNNLTAKNLQAEYLLKSTVNAARALLIEDSREDDTFDAEQDPWAFFINGLEVSSLLGINSGVRVELEIRPENTKIPLRRLLSGRNAPRAGDTRWRDALAKLFTELGFDEDGEENKTENFTGRVFSSQELVSVLIDYMDQDEKAYRPEDSFAEGIERDGLPLGFSNRPIRRFSELGAVPGFTAKRMRQLFPLLSAWGNSTVNINLAPLEVLTALHPDMDPARAQAIIESRSEEPFDNVNKSDKLRDIFPDDVVNELVQFMIQVRSSKFQVIAKVDYGTAVYFMRAQIEKGRSGQLPRIESIELSF